MAKFEEKYCLYLLNGKKVIARESEQKGMIRLQAFKGAVCRMDEVPTFVPELDNRVTPGMVLVTMEGIKIKSY